MAVFGLLHVVAGAFIAILKLVFLCSAVEQFIRAKYERKQYLSRGGSAEATSKPTTTAAKEVQEQKARVKPKKATAAQKSSIEQVQQLYGLLYRVHVYVIIIIIHTTLLILISTLVRT